ncbi:MAG: hypothetical protein QXL01_03215 [Thermoplasmatales archaeon]
MNYLTDEDRNKFYDYLYKWQKRLGLEHWSIRRTAKKTKNMAMCVFDDPEHKMVKVLLGNNWHSCPVTDHNLESTAVHEILHILLHDLIEHARTKPKDDIGIAKEEHAVINRLEQIIIGLPDHK